jgi:hypothetical protein
MTNIMCLPHKEKPQAVIFYDGKWIRGWSRNSRRKDSKQIEIEVYETGDCSLFINNIPVVVFAKLSRILEVRHPEIQYWVIRNMNAAN